MALYQARILYDSSCFNQAIFVKLIIVILLRIIIIIYIYVCLCYKY